MPFEAVCSLVEKDYLDGHTKDEESQQSKILEVLGVSQTSKP